MICNSRIKRTRSTVRITPPVTSQSGQGPGGDNPAFSRADELRRGITAGRPDRLPSYHEAIHRDFHSPPLTSQAPPSYRTSLSHQITSSSSPHSDSTSQSRSSGE